MAERATLSELLEFANKVREAGGGNPLDALMPAVPQDASQCLIAKNLNFNCKVHHGPCGADGDEVFEGVRPEDDAWCMLIEDKALRNRIAEALDLPKVSWHEKSWDGGRNTFYAIELPKRIGAVAAEFDKWEEAIDVQENVNHPNADAFGEVWYICEIATPQDIERFKEFWPYIDASIKEAYSNATFVNDDGAIVV